MTSDKPIKALEVLKCINGLEVLFGVSNEAIHVVHNGSSSLIKLSHNEARRLAINLRKALNEVQRFEVIELKKG